MLITLQVEVVKALLQEICSCIGVKFPHDTLLQELLFPAGWRWQSVINHCYNQINIGLQVKKREHSRTTAGAPHRAPDNHFHDTPGIGAPRAAVVAQQALQTPSSLGAAQVCKYSTQTALRTITCQLCVADPKYVGLKHTQPQRCQRRSHVVRHTRPPPPPDVDVRCTHQLRADTIKHVPHRQPHWQHRRRPQAALQL